MDIGAFVSLIFEIRVGHPWTLPDDANTEGIFDPIVPEIVFDIIDTIGMDCGSKCSLNSIFSLLEVKNFQIVSGLDSVEVLAFVRWVKQYEE
jgi:hypothetical protein